MIFDKYHVAYFANIFSPKMYPVNKKFQDPVLNMTKLEIENKKEYLIAEAYFEIAICLRFSILYIRVCFFGSASSILV